MVPDMTQKHSMMLFIEGLQDRLKGLVRAFQLATLKDAIDVTLKLDTTPTSYQTDKKPSGNIQASQRPPSQAKDTPPPPPKVDLDSRNELRMRKLCFSCKEPWVPRHRCLGQEKAHLIEVISDADNEEVWDIDDKDDGVQIEVEDEEDRMTICLDSWARGYSGVDTLL